MDIDVFISHHTNSSINIVEAIVNRLESYGIRCWYAPRNTQGAYGKSIANAIDKCQIFLLILNKPASESEHVLNELELVFDRVSNKENVTILPFHTADEIKDISREAQYYIRRQHWIDALTPPIYQRIDELVQKILVMLGNKATLLYGDPANRTKTEYSIVSKIPQTREVFLGRDLILDEISAFFESGKRVLFLEGIGGIGKSELAKQYAIRNRHKYSKILFLTYVDSLRALVCDPQMVEITGLTQGLEEDYESFFNRKIQVLRAVTDEHTLFIIDNFDVDTDPDFKTFIEGSHNIIITTRNTHPGYNAIKIEAIDNGDIVFEIFEKHYGMTLSNEDKPYLSELFAMVDYHTYTIELLAKQMEASFVSGKELLEMFKSGQLANQSSEKIAGRNSTQTAFNHIKSLFNINILSENEIQILRELSLMGNGGVPANYFWKWSTSAPIETIKKTVLSLVRRSWVRRENTENGPVISLHPLVSELVRTDDTIKPNAVNCRQLLDGLSEDMFYAWYTPYKDNLSIADCVLSIADYFTPFEFDTDDKDLFCIWTQCANFLWQVGKFSDAIKIGHTVYNTCLQLCGEASMLTGFAAKALGGCYFNSRQKEKSIKWYMQGLHSMRLSGAAASNDLALSYEKVARCYTWKYMQDFDKAEELFRCALDIREQVIAKLERGQSVCHIEKQQKCTIEKMEEGIAEILLEMGRMYQEKSEYDTALTYAEKSRVIYERVNPNNTSSISYTYYDKGVCYYHIGVKEKEKGNVSGAMDLLKSAKENFSIALESNMKMRGAYAIDTIDNVEYLADAYAALGEYREAANNYILVLTMLENLFDEDNVRIKEVKKKMDFKS